MALRFVGVRGAVVVESSEVNARLSARVKSLRGRVSEGCDWVRNEGVRYLEFLW